MIKKLWPLVILGIFIGIFWLGGFYHYLNVEEVIARKDELQTLINDNPVMAALGFGILYALIVALSLPFASFLTLTAGFLFGFIWGALIVAIGATTGATAIFLIARSSAGAILREKAGKLYQKIGNEMRENAVSYLLFLRLVPLFPFFLVNIVPAFFDVKTRTYIWTTFIGILPGTMIYVNVGRSLGSVENPGDLVSPDLIISVALLGVAALTPILYKKWKGKNHVAG